MGSDPNLNAASPSLMEADAVVANILGWYAAVFCGLCLAWYACALLEPRGRWSFWLLAGGYAAARMLCPVLLPGEETGTSATVVRVLILLVWSAVLCAVCCRRSGSLLIYVCLSWAAIFELTFFISYTVVFAGDPVYDSLADRFLSDPQYGAENYLRMTLTVAYLFQCIMSALLTLLCIFSCRSIIRNFPRGRIQLTLPEFRLLVLPAVVGLLVGLLLRMLVVAVADGVPVLLFDRYAPLKVVVPGIAAVTGAAIIYAVHTFRSMVSLEEEKRARLIIEGQLQSLRELVEDTERTNGQVARLRHDLRNTLTVIQALSEDLPAGEALRSYLAGLNGEVQAMERPFHTGDPVADTLLAVKGSELQGLDPAAAFDTRDFHVPASVISSYDLGIILGNALDNALRALADQKHGERWLRLRSFQHEQLLCLTIENSTDSGAPAVHDELPRSTKEEPGHGMGMQIIRTVAAKYGGTMDWKADSGTFRLVIMLKCPSSGALPD